MNRGGGNARVRAALVGLFLLAAVGCTDGARVGAPSATPQTPSPLGPNDAPGSALLTASDLGGTWRLNGRTRQARPALLRVCDQDNALLVTTQSDRITQQLLSGVEEGGVVEQEVWALKAQATAAVAAYRASLKSCAPQRGDNDGHGYAETWRLEHGTDDTLLVEHRKVYDAPALQGRWERVAVSARANGLSVVVVSMEGAAPWEFVRAVEQRARARLCYFDRACGRASPESTRISSSPRPSASPSPTQPTRSVKPSAVTMPARYVTNDQGGTWVHASGDGRRVRELVPADGVIGAAYLHRESSYVYLARRTSTTTCSGTLVRIPLSGGVEKTVARPAARRAFYNPTVSADGRFVAYEDWDCSDPAGGVQSVAVTDLHTGVSRHWTNERTGAYGIADLRLSPDGSALAFRMQIPGQTEWDLRRLDLNGTSDLRESTRWVGLPAGCGPNGLGHWSRAIGLAVSCDRAIGSLTPSGRWRTTCRIDGAIAGDYGPMPVDIDESGRFALFGLVFRHSSDLYRCSTDGTRVKIASSAPEISW